MVNLAMSFERVAENPIQGSGSSIGAVQIDPESLSKLIDALNKVDKNDASAFRNLNSAYEAAKSANKEEKKSLLDNVVEEVGSTLLEIVSIETHLDLFVLTALLSVVFYTLFLAVNGVWSQITNSSVGMPIIRVMVSHPYLLVICTYLAVLYFFTDGQS
jgi:hypothetical protein